MKKALVSAFFTVCLFGASAVTVNSAVSLPITSDADVRTDGRLLYALCFNSHHTWASGDTVEVNGVPFRYCEGKTSECWGTAISPTGGGGTPLSLSAAGNIRTNWTNSGASDNYAGEVLFGCYGASGKTFRQIDVLGLRDGGRYLLQVWCGQTPASGYEQQVEVVTLDPAGAANAQTVTVNMVTGPFGGHVAYDFVATGTSVTLRFKQDTSSECRSFLNALQVREIPLELDPICTDGSATQILSVVTSAFPADAAVHVGGTLSVVSDPKTTDAKWRKLWMQGPATIGFLSLADVEVDLFDATTVGGIRFDQSELTETDDYATDGTVPTLVATKPLAGLTDLSGCGRFFAEGMQTVTVANASLFMGTLGGGMSVVKRGAGTLTLFGTNAFTGSLRIEQGKLALGTLAALRDRLNILYDLDAGVADSITTNANGAVTKWKDSMGGEAYYKTGVGEPFLTNAFFCGRQAVNFGVSTKEMRFLKFWKENSESVQPAALFAVCHQHERVAKNGRGRLWTPDYTTTGSRALAIYADETNVRLSLVEQTSGVFYNETASNRGCAADEYPDMVVSVVGVSNRVQLANYPDKTQILGGGRTIDISSNAPYCFAGAVGEFLALGDQPSELERELVVAYLLRKWNVKDGGGELVIPAYETIPHTADVVMAPGATLDLGGDDLGDVRVASFTGAGTVTNGHLRTASGEFVQRGGSLTIPAVSDSVYVASSASEPLVITGGASAENVTIRLPDGYVGDRDAGKKAIFFEGTPKFVDASGRELTSLPVHKTADGWWRVNSGIVLIVR